MKTGFQYSVNIDQAAAENCGLPEDIDDRHLAILSVCEKLFAWKGAKRLEDNGETYYLLSWQLIRDRLPRFRLNSRSRIKATVKRLVEVGLLECHPNNVATGQSWYRFGDLYAGFVNFDPSQKWTPRPKSGTVPSQKWDGTRPKNGTVPVPNLGRNDNKENDIKNDIKMMRENAAVNEKYNGWKGQVLADQMFVEMARMKTKLSEERFAALLDQFTTEKIALKKTNHRDFADYRDNFFYWLQKQPAQKQQTDGFIITEETYNSVLADILTENNERDGSEP